MLNEDGVACPGLGLILVFGDLTLIGIRGSVVRLQKKPSDRVGSLHGGREMCGMAFNELIWGLEERNG
jgi:hypothetical protein